MREGSCGRRERLREKREAVGGEAGCGRIRRLWVEEREAVGGKEGCRRRGKLWEKKEVEGGEGGYGKRGRLWEEIKETSIFESYGLPYLQS